MIDRVPAPSELGREIERAREILTDLDPPWIPGRSATMCRAYIRGVDVTPRSSLPHAAAEMARSEPLGEDEVDPLIDRWLRGPRYWFQIEELVLALESQLGSDAAGTRIAARLAKVPPHDVLDLGAFFGNALTVPADAALFCLGFVALRSAPTQRALADLRTGATGAARQVLDLVLDGAEGCRRHGLRHLFGASFAGDGPGYLALLSASERLHSSLTPRFPYLGGDTVLAHYVERARRTSVGRAPRRRPFRDDPGSAHDRADRRLRRVPPHPGRRTRLAASSSQLR